MLFLFLSPCLKLLAQTRQVTGKVTDGKTNEILTGVTVLVRGTTIGTATDIYGNFRIKVPTGAVLEVKMVGYVTTTITPDLSKPMAIKLSPNNNDLSDVIVVGYGTEKKAVLTGAISTVGQEVFKDRPVPNVEMALQGAIPGLTITKTSTRPGNEGLGIRLRGESSVSGIEPLVIIDGVPSVGGNELSQINPADIESVTVLKDGSAAIYGARAQDGVILITTKRGKGGKPQVSLNSNFSYNDAAVKVPWATMGQWASLYLQASYDDRVDANGNPVQFLPQWTNATLERMTLNQPFTYTDPAGVTHGYANNNWQSALYAPSWSDQQSLAVRGSTDNSAYALSLGYSKDQSLLKTAFDGQIRYNVRLNYDYIISKRIKLQTGISYDDRNVQSPKNGIGAGFFDAPIFPTYNIGGNFYDDYGYRNPVAATKLGGTIVNDYNYIRLNSALNIDIIKGLKFTGTAAYTNNTTSGTAYNLSYNLYNYLNTLIDNTQNPTQAITESYGKVLYQDFGAQLDYKTTVGDYHNFSFMAANTGEFTDTKAVTAGRTNLLYDGLYALNTATSLNATNSGSENQVGLVSYIARFNYNYKEKYIFEALGRRDGSSRFDPTYQWANFYNLSGGWVLSQENFLKQVRFINYLKIRADYGQTGGQASLGPYDYISTVNATGTALFGSAPALQQIATLGIATNLRTWERMENKNIGLDYTVLNNKLTGSIDVYQRTNIGMLIGLVYPTVLGATAPTTNSGDLRVRGWEFSTNWKDKAGQVFYNIGFNISNNQNVVTSYAGKDSWNAGVTAIRQGYPLNSLFVYKTAGYFQTQAEVNAYYAEYGNRGNLSAMTGNSVLRPGDLKVVDLDGDGTISPTGNGKKGSGDVYYYGDTAPHYTFGMNLGLRWKWFDFSTFIQGQLRQYILRTGNTEGPFFRNYVNVNTTYIGKTWTPQDPNAEYPRLSFDNNRNGWNWSNNDVNVQNERYARVKSLILGYTLPKDMLGKLDLSRVRVYFSGSDLFLLSSVKDGFDPERGTSADSSYPLFRTFSLGLDVAF